MKRLFCLLLAACVMLSLCACEKGREKDAGNDASSSNEELSASTEIIPTPNEQGTPGKSKPSTILDPVNDSQKNLMLQLTGFGATVENAFEEKAPHKICAYIYEVSNAFNSFYHETKILIEENEAQKASFIQLLKLTKKVLETCIDLLGFSAPDRM